MSAMPKVPQTTADQLRSVIKSARTLVRRRALFSVLLLSMPVLLFTARAAEQPLPGAVQRLVVTGQGYFPVAQKLQDGRIAVVLRGGAATHVGIKGRLDIVYSNNGGITWSKPTVVVDAPGLDDRNPAFGQANDGTLVVAFWRAAKNTHQDYDDLEDPSQPVNTWVTRSADAGKTWSEPVEIDVREIRFGSPYGKILTLPDGTMLMNIYGYGVRTPVAKLKSKDNYSYLYRSRDAGRSWQRYATLGRNFNETALLRLKDGTLLGAMRAEGSSPSVSVIRSIDGGRIWSYPEPVSPPPAHPADLVLLPDARVFLVTGFRVAPFGIRGVVSDATGRFDWQTRFVLVGDSTHWDTGYPSSVVLDSGRVLTFYYAVGSRTHPDWGFHTGVVDYQVPSLTLSPPIYPPIAMQMQRAR